MKTPFFPALLVLFASCAVADADIPAECERLSPADAVVLTVAQLQVRYCEAKDQKIRTSGKKVAATFDRIDSHDYLNKTNRENAEIDRQSEKSMDRIHDQYAACEAAMKNISKLIAEKGKKINDKCGNDGYSEGKIDKVPGGFEFDDGAEAARVLKIEEAEKANRK
jgi:hypothetical protein